MRKIQRWFVLVSFLFVNVCALGQAAPRQFAVRAGRLIDVRTGGMTVDACILVSGEQTPGAAESFSGGVTASLPISWRFHETSAFAIVLNASCPCLADED